MIDINVVQLDSELPLPRCAKQGDAGLDLYAREPVKVAANGGRVVVPTGVAIAIPEGYAGFVQPRSGLAAKHGVTVANAPGLIDSGYRDEVKVILLNTDPRNDFAVERGDRIAQLVIQKVEEVRWNVVSELGDSERGVGGFGHSGR